MNNKNKLSLKDIVESGLSLGEIEFFLLSFQQPYSVIEYIKNDKNQWSILKSTTENSLFLAFKRVEKRFKEITRKEMSTFEKKEFLINLKYEFFLWKIVIKPYSEHNV